MKKVTQYVDRFLERTTLGDQLNENRDYFRLWTEVVGKHVAYYTMPVMIKEKKMTVEVTDSTWLFHLTMLKSKIIADFNAAMGFDKIEELNFINADFRSRERKINFKGPARTENFFDGGEEVINIEPAEEEKLKKAVLLSPEPLQQRLYNLLKESCLYQKRQSKKISVSKPSDFQKGER